VPASNKGKGKAGPKATDKGKDGEDNVVYDYHENSVHDLALRAQVLQGYDEFKVRVSCRLLFVHANGAIYGLLLHRIAYARIFHVYPRYTGTTGTGATAGEVLYGVGVEVGYPGRVRIR